uniref:Uncharacterized protein n=1 Tax=Setaria digitata TaxID=48799 RepID=A0A915PW92_9BILA
MIPDDIKMYLDGGKSLFFMIFHSTIIISTFILYRYNRLARNNFFIRFETRKIQTKLNRGANSTMPTEAKLVLPCICNTVVFLAGQVVITVGVGEGPWASWLIMILFTLTAATDPFSLLIFSGAVR